MRKRIFSCALCILLMISNILVVPVSASSIPMDGGTVDFFSWVFDAGGHAINSFLSFFDHSVCPLAPPGVGRHSFVKQHTMVGDKTGYFYICEYCGVSAGEVGKDTYQEQVDSLPAPGYNSDGSLLIPTEIISHKFLRNSDWGYMNSVCSNHSVPFEKYGASKATFLCDSNKVVASLLSGNTSFPSDGVEYYGKLVAPYDGFYQRIESLSYNAHLTFIDGTSEDKQVNYIAASSPVYYTSGSPVFDGRLFCSIIGRDLFCYECIGYPAYYKFIPAPSSDLNFENQYNINSRPTAITGGNYGIVGDNGQITTVTNHNQIINETNNTYYNPATGQTQAITDWTYNYDGRIYDITLDTGDKVSVEYGDQNITITENNVVEGGTTVNNYTIYYIINGSGDTPSPTPGPTTCPHAWAETSRTDPTCTAPGKAVSVCSKCGQTKTDPLPALGHDWELVRTVPTEYDEAGTQTQAGYTLYECTRCKEQYKDTDSTGPPGDDPPEDGGLIDFLNGIIQALSDNLSGAVELVLRFFREIPKLFDGFTGFLAAVFPFLPDEIMLLLTFGMAALVFVGVIKAIRR